MKQINLSQRLSAAAAWVPLGARLCDVGTDHAALPIRLMQEGRVRRAIATDIRQGPLDRARGNVERYGYTGRIELRLCDGLAEVRREEVNAVTICGMGGNMIASILEAAPWTRERTDLILQPMKSQGELRSWLRDHGYRVNRERVLWEEGHWYTLFAVRGGEDTVSLTPGRREAGVPARWCREPSRLPYLAYMEKRLERQRAGLERAAREVDQDRLAYLQDALSELAAWRVILEKGAWPI